MPAKYFVEIGRVALVHFGPDAGKVCAIVDVVDQNRALVDGPDSGVQRQAIPFKRLRLTKFRIQIPHGTSSRVVSKAWKKSEIDKKWVETAMAKRLASYGLKTQMSDFDRFKLYKTRQQMNRLVDRKVLVLKNQEKKAKPKPAKLEKKAKKPKKTTGKKPQAAAPKAAPAPAKKEGKKK